jgi:hypothetical protein
MKKFAPTLTIYEGVKQGNRFCSAYEANPKTDPTLLLDGTLAYRIIGYAETIDEAQLKISGRTYPLDDSTPTIDYDKKI